ncbi:MAG: hypothetical protein QF692_09410 [Alphaproteobacteria bacterium]|nr:hypothetical protein [Alphaproteobacteria bacterium]MDP7223462.1 hypothetical protein [Alphaproteobacteria bacterium]
MKTEHGLHRVSDANAVASDPVDLQSGVCNPLVHRAAQGLIDRYKDGMKIGVEAFDVPHDAFVSISEQLEDLGVAQSISAPLVSALKEYVLGKGGRFARAVNAKPIYIAAAVSDVMPQFRFEEGVTEMAAIDDISIKVEGVASVELRTTINGSQMTSNRADVDKMFAHVKGYKLWIQFEAPTQNELDGLLSAQDASLAAVGQAIGGAVSAEGLQAVLTEMEQDGMFSEDLLFLLEDIVEMRALMESGATPDSEPRLQELADAIMTEISNGLTDGTMPLSLMQGAMESVSLLSEMYDVEMVLPQARLDALHDKADIVAMVQELSVAIDVGSSADHDQDAVSEIIQDIEALVTQLDHMDADTRQQVLTQITRQIDTIDVPDVAAEGLSAIIVALADLDGPAAAIGAAVSSNGIDHVDHKAAAPEQSAEKTADKTADKMADKTADALQDHTKEMLAVLQEVASFDDAPPAVQDCIESLAEKGVDVADMTPEQMGEALTTQDGSVLTEMMQTLVTTISDPQVQAALPSDVAVRVDSVVQDNVVLDAVLVDASAPPLAEAAQVTQSSQTNEDGASIATDIDTMDVSATDMSVDENSGAHVAEGADQQGDSHIEDASVVSDQRMPETEVRTVQNNEGDAGPQRGPDAADAMGAIDGGQDTVIHAAEIFADAVHDQANVTPQVLRAAESTAEIIDFQAHQTAAHGGAPQAVTAPVRTASPSVGSTSGPAESVSSGPVSTGVVSAAEPVQANNSPAAPATRIEQATAHEMREAFQDASPPNGKPQDAIKLDKDILSPEEEIRNHPAGCTCSSCAGADLGHGQEADLSATMDRAPEMDAPLENYQPMESSAPDAKIPESMHPPGCTCPSCAGADLGHGQEADLAADYDGPSDIPLPQNDQHMKLQPAA